MKQKLIISFFICFVSAAAPVKAAQIYKLSVANYKVFINDIEYKDAELPILNYNGSTYAPMRSMLEAAGLKVEFSNGAATVRTLSNYETEKNLSNDVSGNQNTNEYVTIREAFESTNLIPAFNKDDRTVEIYNDKSELLLVIPKEYTLETNGALLILRSYYESDLKPLIDKNK